MHPYYEFPVICVNVKMTMPDHKWEKLHMEKVEGWEQMELLHLSVGEQQVELSSSPKIWWTFKPYQWI